MWPKTRQLPAPAPDPVLALTAPGAAYELTTVLVDGVPNRIFRASPQTLCEAYRTLARFESRVLSVDGERRTSYGETLKQAAALGRFMAARHGIGAGTRVAIIMRNSAEWMTAFIGVTALGATAVLVNNRGTAGEIAAALDDTETTLVIADERRAGLLAKQRRPLIVHGDMAGIAHGTPFAEAIAGWQTAQLQPAAAKPDDTAVIMFTSGTTAGGKAAQLSHRGVLTGLMNIQFSMAVIGARFAQHNDGCAALKETIPSALLAVPLFHASGCYSIFLSCLLRGGKVVVLPKWHVERALDLIERERIAAFSGPPSMLWDLARARRAGRDLSCLQSLGFAGQAFQPQLLREVAAAFPHVVLGRGYGMTEANGSICLIAGAELLQRPGSSGRVIATADIKLIDDRGAEVPAGSVGEICVRGAMVMQGYCKRPDQTEQALRDGWLHTGDLGLLDADGYLDIVGRKKDIIISGGDKISCSEVENVVATHPAVADAAVFGIDDERLGEIVVVAVVLQADCLVDARTLKSHVAARLAIYKVPRMVMYCTELPRNALDKVNRHELRRQFLEQRPRWRAQGEHSTARRLNLSTPDAR